MPKCPKCGDEIDTLRHAQKGVSYFDAFLNSEGEMSYQHDSFEADDAGEYYCPACDKTLFTGYDGQEKAIKFLKGKG